MESSREIQYEERNVLPPSRNEARNEDRETAKVGRRLAEGKDEILRRWEVRVRGALPAAAPQPSSELRDSLPDYIDRIVEILQYPEPREVLSQLNAKLAREHGIARARQPGFSLAQVIDEYQILRETFFELIEEEHEISRDVRNLILDAIQVGVRNAASEYERLRYYEGLESNERSRQIEAQYQALKRSIPGYQEVRQSAARVLIGAGVTLGVVALSEALYQLGLPRPVYVPFVAVAFAAYFGGLLSGFLGVAVISVYAISRVSLLEAVEVTLASLGVVLIVGLIRWRVYHLSRQVISEADAILAARAATEQRLRDVHDQLDTLVQARTAELTRHQQLFLSLVEGVKDYAIFAVNPEGYITTWNTGAVRMEQYSVEEAVGRHFSMLYTEEARLRNESMGHLANALKEGRFRGEGIRVKKSGEIFLADVLITPMFTTGKLSGFSVVIQDLTERKQLLQERDVSKAHAEELEQDLAERGVFVAALSHDLRNPLTSARVSAELIARRNEAREGMLAKRIVANINRADQMIGNMLDTYRLQAGKKLLLEFNETDAADVVNAVVEELSISSGSRFAVKIENQVEPGKPIRGYWNRDSLRRILENLLTNALKYGDADAPVTISVTRADTRVSFAVHNLGNTILLADQERLFQQYERGNSAEINAQKGWGLGLTLVRALVDAHRGLVKVESYPKSGTTFTIDLPLDSRPTH